MEENSEPGNAANLEDSRLLADLPAYPHWWAVPAEYATSGPSGYEPSSERFTEDVCERLTQHGWIDASDVEVAVDNGIVRLNGEVEDRRSKRIAEDVAESVSGVMDVSNRLRVEAIEYGERGQ